MKAKKLELPKTEEFQNLIDLLAVFSEASNQLANLQAVANDHLLEVLDDMRPQYAELQEKLTQAEAAMELIARTHPEWFREKKTIKTPYGTVRLHKSTKLAVPNEEATILLIKHHAEKVVTNNAASLPGEPIDTFTAETYIRTREELDIEALEKLDDATLRQFRIKRIEEQNFSAKPAALDMGKAVSEANQQQEAA